MLRVSEESNNAKQSNTIRMNKYYIVGNQLYEQEPTPEELNWGDSKASMYTVTCTSIEGAKEFLRMLQRARLANPELK